MKIEEIKRDILEDLAYMEMHSYTPKEVDTSYIIETIDSMHNLLTEMCESLVLQVSQSNVCENCGVYRGFTDVAIAHKRDCPVLKAQKYLQQNKEKS